MEFPNKEKTYQVVDMIFDQYPKINCSMLKNLIMDRMYLHGLYELRIDNTADIRVHVDSLLNEIFREGFLQDEEYYAYSRVRRLSPHGATLGSLSRTGMEKPCQHCQRKNDVGVKSCWWCTNTP